MLTLYGYWRSSAAYRVRIAINYKQLTAEHIAVNLINNGGEHHQKTYTKLNPQRLVPTLKDDNLVLTQSLAIIEYLNDKYPQHSLLPENINDKAIVRSMAQAIACDIHPLNNLRVLTFLNSSLEISKEQRSLWYRHWILEGFNAFEQMLEKYSGQFCFQNDFSLADVCLIPQVYNAKRFDIPLNNYPNIMRISDACDTLTWVKKSSPETQMDAVYS